MFLKFLSFLAIVLREFRNFVVRFFRVLEFITIQFVEWKYWCFTCYSSHCILGNWRLQFLKHSTGGGESVLRTLCGTQASTINNLLLEGILVSEVLPKFCSRLEHNILVMLFIEKFIINICNLIYCMLIISYNLKTELALYKVFIRLYVRIYFIKFFMLGCMLEFILLNSLC